MAKNEKTLERKFSQFDVKSVDLERSEFTGFGSAIGNEDLGGDIIEPGAFNKTIKERVPKGYIKLLDNHNDSSTRNVWGTVKEAREVPWEGKGEDAPTHKLFTRFSVSKADPDAQIALRKIDEGHIDQLSIGYRALDVEYEKDEGADFEDARMAWIMGQGIRRIKEIQLWEVSMVIWGMNPEATIIQNSINRLTNFAQKAAKAGSPIPEEEVKSAILALNNMIGKDADDSQREAIAMALDGVSNAVENVCTLAGKTNVDPLRYFVEEYHKTHDVWNDESFGIWVTEQVKGEIEVEEEDSCGCSEGSKSEEEAADDPATDDNLGVISIKGTNTDDIVIDSNDGGTITLESIEQDLEQDELVQAIGKLTEALSEFKSAADGAETSSSEEDATPDAETEEPEETKDSHTEDVEEAAKDADEEGRSKHFPGEDEVATELERLELMALEFDFDN